MNIYYPVLFAVLLGFVANAAATTLARMSLQDLVNAARVVARVHCVATEARWYNGEIWTFSSFQVQKVWKGPVPEHFTVRLLGGHVGNLTSVVPGVPRFTAGEELVLFLEPARPADYAVTAWTEGTFRIHRSGITGREFVTQDVAFSPPAGFANRSALGSAIRDLPLEAFEKQLLAALNRKGEISR
jgi:hypothetical protein